MQFNKKFLVTYAGPQAPKAYNYAYIYNYTIIIFYMKITILLSIFFSKYTPKRINRNMFTKCSPWVIPHSKRVSKIFIFYIKNDDFWKILKTKSDQNTHQNAPNCTILNKFIGGAWPRTPLAKRMASPWATCKFPNLKKKFLPSPSQILATPLCLCRIYREKGWFYR